RLPPLDKSPPTYSPALRPPPPAPRAPATSSPKPPEHADHQIGLPYPIVTQRTTHKGASTPPPRGRGLGGGFQTPSCIYPRAPLLQLFTLRVPGVPLNQPTPPASDKLIRLPPSCAIGHLPICDFGVSPCPPSPPTSRSTSPPASTTPASTPTPLSPTTSPS